MRTTTKQQPKLHDGEQGFPCRSQKRVPASLDVFGWCTWDAFYFRVSAKGIMDGLQSLRDGGITPKLLVIDDGHSLPSPVLLMLPYQPVNNSDCSICSLPTTLL